MVAEESGAAHFGFGGAMLLDLPGPALRLLTDVADFHFRVGFESHEARAIRRTSNMTDAA